MLTSFLSSVVVAAAPLASCVADGGGRNEVARANSPRERVEGPAGVVEAPAAPAQTAPAPVAKPAEPPAPPEPSPFTLAVEAARTRASAALDSKKEDLDAGDVASSIAAVRAALPDWEKDAAQALALGQALFALDRAADGPAHAGLAKAHALTPDEPAVAAAWGRALQRRGDFAGAAEAYARALDRHRADALLLHALRAVALVLGGDVDGAIAEWRAGQPLQSRAAIEAALAEIHGAGDKEAERRALLARVRAGDDAAIEPLLVLDVDWTGTGDHKRAHREHATRDLALAKEKLGEGSRRYVELEFFVTGRLSMEPRPKDAPALPEPARADLDAMGLAPSQVEKTARKLGFMGYGKKGKTLPVSPALAPAIFRMIFLDGDVVATEWIGWFEPELLARAKGEGEGAKPDLHAALLLLDLYDQAIERRFDDKWGELVPKREEVERVAWQHFPEARVAARVLQRRAKDVKPDDPVLMAAVERFADDLRIAVLASEAAKRAGAHTEEHVVRRARAAFLAADFGEAQRAMTELVQMRLGAATKPAVPPRDGK